VLRWGAERGIELHFIDPDKPVQNAHIDRSTAERETSSRTCTPSMTLDQARAAATTWLLDCNEVRYRTARSATARRRSSRIPLQLSTSQRNQLPEKPSQVRPSDQGRALTHRSQCRRARDATCWIA
jgi:hypothetical protein